MLGPPGPGSGWEPSRAGVVARAGWQVRLIARATGLICLPDARLLGHT